MSAPLLRERDVRTKYAKPGRLSIQSKPETFEQFALRIFPHTCMRSLGFDCAICRWVRDKKWTVR